MQVLHIAAFSNGVTLGTMFAVGVGKHFFDGWRSLGVHYRMENSPRSGRQSCHSKMRITSCNTWQLNERSKWKRRSGVAFGEVLEPLVALAVGFEFVALKKFNKEDAKPALHSKETGDLHCIRSNEDHVRNPSDSAVSRRKLLQTTVALCGSTTFLASQAESNALTEDFTITKKVFFDIAIDGQPIGEIVVGLYGADVPVGAQRFAELAVGQRGIGYRRKEFGKVTPTYIQNNGVRSFSLSGGTADAAQITGGENNETLAAEMADLDKKGSRPKNVVGAVSLFVVDPTKPPPKTKLVAKNGKFVVLEEESRPDPNGTEFMIVTADSPQLDRSNLVVGRVLEGYDVIKRMAGVKVVNENSSSPYFQTAKLIGDSRAVVAEKGFYRPYSKIVITSSGELQ